MTRINLIPVTELADQHLIAEIRELPRVFTLAQNNDSTINIPDTFRMGKGHVLFFKDKLLFLFIRYLELYHEALLRGFNISYSLDDIENKLYLCNPKLVNNWTPNDSDIAISRQRINEKLKSNPSFYRWTKY